MSGQHGVGENELSGGWPGGQGLGQQWTEGGAQVGPGLAAHSGIWVGACRGLNSSLLLGEAVCCGFAV